MADTPKSSLEPWSPDESEKQQAEEKKEALKIAGSAEVINDVLAWLQAQADLYSSIDSINIHGNSSAEDIRVAILTAKKLRKSFLSAKKQLQEIYGITKPEGGDETVTDDDEDA